MSECCVEEGFLQALRALECTPIPAQQHFVGVRRGEECLPYLVLATSEQPGLRTSSGQEMQTAARITAYFSPDKTHDAMSFRRLLSQWISSSGCLPLGVCGCFCVRSLGSVGTQYNERSVQVSVTLSGLFAASLSSSSA
jgi:hypothetical protein